MPASAYKVLVAPLNWGLGHATRCIPLVEALLQAGAETHIAAEGPGRKILEARFPNTRFVELPGMAIRYPEKGSMAGAMLKQLPSLFAAIAREQRATVELQNSNRYTHLLSDNRYGVYVSGVPSVLMTHQVRISGGKKFGFLEPVLFRMHRKLISRFDELWIPDCPPPGNLAGSLADVRNLQVKSRYIGWLSRFKSPAHSGVKKFDVVALLSGPEPQRTLFENKLKATFATSGKACLIIRGIPGQQVSKEEEGIRYVNEADDGMLADLLHPETLLVCRPGYSTLMDLGMLGHKNTLFIPTPGQTEQEYLATRLRDKFHYAIQSQETPIAISNLTPGSALPAPPDPDLVRKTIVHFLTRGTRHD